MYKKQLRASLLTVTLFVGLGSLGLINPVSAAVVVYSCPTPERIATGQARNFQKGPFKHDIGYLKDQRLEFSITYALTGSTQPKVLETMSLHSSTSGYFMTCTYDDSDVVVQARLDQKDCKIERGDDKPMKLHEYDSQDCGNGQKCSVICK